MAGPSRRGKKNKGRSSPYPERPYDEDNESDTEMGNTSRVSAPYTGLQFPANFIPASGRRGAMSNAPGHTRAQTPVDFHEDYDEGPPPNQTHYNHENNYRAPSSRPPPNPYLDLPPPAPTATTAPAGPVPANPYTQYVPNPVPAPSVNIIISPTDNYPYYDTSPINRTGSERNGPYQRRLERATNAMGLQRKQVFTAGSQQPGESDRAWRDRYAGEEQRRVNEEANHRQRLATEPWYADQWRQDRARRRAYNDQRRADALVHRRQYDALQGRPRTPAPADPEDSGDDLYAAEFNGNTGPYNTGPPAGFPNLGYMPEPGQFPPDIRTNPPSDKCNRCTKNKKACDLGERGWYPCTTCVDVGLADSCSNGPGRSKPVRGPGSVPPNFSAPPTRNPFEADPRQVAQAAAEEEEDERAANDSEEEIEVDIDDIYTAEGDTETRRVRRPPRRTAVPARYRNDDDEEEPPTQRPVSTGPLGVTRPAGINPRDFVIPTADDLVIRELGFTPQSGQFPALVRTNPPSTKCRRCFLRRKGDCDLSNTGYPCTPCAKAKVPNHCVNDIGKIWNGPGGTKIKTKTSTATNQNAETSTFNEVSRAIPQRKTAEEKQAAAEARKRKAAETKAANQALRERRNRENLDAGQRERQGRAQTYYEEYQPRARSASPLPVRQRGQKCGPCAARNVVCIGDWYPCEMCKSTGIECDHPKVGSGAAMARPRPVYHQDYSDDEDDGNDYQPVSGRRSGRRRQPTARSRNNALPAPARSRNNGVLPAPGYFEELSRQMGGRRQSAAQPGFYEMMQEQRERFGSAVPSGNVEPPSMAAPPNLRTPTVNEFEAYMDSVEPQPQTSMDWDDPAYSGGNLPAGSMNTQQEVPNPYLDANAGTALDRYPGPNGGEFVRGLYFAAAPNNNDPDSNLFSGLAIDGEPGADVDIVQVVNRHTNPWPLPGAVTFNFDSEQRYRGPASNVFRGQVPWTTYRYSEGPEGGLAGCDEFTNYCAGLYPVFGMGRDLCMKEARKSCKIQDMRHPGYEHHKCGDCHAQSRIFFNPAFLEIQRRVKGPLCQQCADEIVGRGTGEGAVTVCACINTFFGNCFCHNHTRDLIDNYVAKVLEVDNYLVRQYPIFANAVGTHSEPCIGCAVNAGTRSMDVWGCKLCRLWTQAPGAPGPRAPVD